MSELQYLYPNSSNNSDNNNNDENDENELNQTAAGGASKVINNQREKRMNNRYGTYNANNRRRELAKHAASTSRGHRGFKDKNNKFTAHLGTRKSNINQLTARNHGAKTRLIGKLAGELQEAKEKRFWSNPPTLRRQYCVGCDHPGLGPDYSGGEWGVGIENRFQPIASNIRTLGRARKRTKRYNQVLKTMRGKLKSGNRLSFRPRRKIAEYATGVGVNHQSKLKKNNLKDRGGGESKGPPKSGGRRRRTRYKRKTTRRKRRKKRRTRRKKR